MFKFQTAYIFKTCNCLLVKQFSTNINKNICFPNLDCGSSCQKPECESNCGDEMNSIKYFSYEKITKKYLHISDPDFTTFRRMWRDYFEIFAIDIAILTNNPDNYFPHNILPFISTLWLDICLDFGSKLSNACNWWMVANSGQN